MPGRQNVVISRNKNFKPDGVDVVSSIDEAIELLSAEDEIMITGGGHIYQQTIEQADRLYLTFIDLTTEGDAFFPEFEHLTLNEVAREAHKPDEKNKYPYEFVTYHVG